MKEIQYVDDDADDFGFTIMSESEIPNNSDFYKAKMLALHKAIMPFLKNLVKDPQKEVIHWPNREKKINDFIKKLDKIIEDK